MTIHIEDLTFDCIIGLLDFERVTPQEVIVDIEASYEYSHEEFINYADMVNDVKYELIENKYKLLEDALLSVKSRLIKNYSKIKTLKIKISKPNILNDCSVALSKEWKF
jgi:dihydroneopterin aldolase